MPFPERCARLPPWETSQRTFLASCVYTTCCHRILSAALNGAGLLLEPIYQISERFCCSPARHSEIILVTLGLPTVPTLDHGICQWNRKMDGHTPAMWHLLEVSLCLLWFKCPAIFLPSKTNKTMLKISCVLSIFLFPVTLHALKARRL